MTSSPLFEAVRDPALDPRPSPLFEATRGTPVVNNVVGLESDQNKSYPTPGGIAIEVDGVLQASGQPILDLLDTLGVTSAVTEDVPNEENEIVVSFDGMRMLRSSNPIIATPSTTALFTVPGGELATIELAIVRCLSTSGTISSPPTCGVGFNGAADNIFASQILTGLTQAGRVYVFPPGGVQAEAVAGSVISFGVDLAPGGGGSMVLAVDLIGRSS